MSLLVMYATKTGATEQCVQLLAAELSPCTVCNIETDKPNLEEEIIADNFSEDLKQAAVCIESFGGYKAYAAPKEGTDQLKGILTDRVKAFSEKFKA